jgi:hypothetical protein
MCCSIPRALKRRCLCLFTYEFRLVTLPRTAIKELVVETEDQDAGVGMIDESTATELIKLSRSGERVVVNIVDPKFATQ